MDKAEQVDGQGFWLFPGLHLIGCATERGIFNGQLYTVVSVGEAIMLRVLDSDQEVECDAAWVMCLKPAHALCYYAAQGRTLRGRVRLWVDHPWLTATHLIVGLVSKGAALTRPQEVVSSSSNLLRRTRARSNLGP